MENEYIDIVFDGPPSHESGRFIEVENSYRRSINFGEWVDRGDYWALRIPDYRNFIAERDKLRARLEAGITLINKRMEDGCLCRKCGPEIRAALSGVTPDRENPRKKTKYRENCTERGENHEKRGIKKGSGRPC